MGKHNWRRTADNEISIAAWIIILALYALVLWWLGS